MSNLSFGGPTFGDSGFFPSQNSSGTAAAAFMFKSPLLSLIIARAALESELAKYFGSDDKKSSSDPFQSLFGKGFGFDPVSLEGSQKTGQSAQQTSLLQSSYRFQAQYSAQFEVASSEASTARQRAQNDTDDSCAQNEGGQSMPRIHPRQGDTHNNNQRIKVVNRNKYIDRSKPVNIFNSPGASVDQSRTGGHRAGRDVVAPGGDYVGNDKINVGGDYVGRDKTSGNGNMSASEGSNIVKGNKNCVKTRNSF